MRKMVIYYEHNAMWLPQDAKAYQVDTTKHRGTNVCLQHICTYCQNTHSQLSIFSMVIQYREMATRLQQRVESGTVQHTPAWVWHSSLTKMQQCMNMFI